MSDHHIDDVVPAGPWLQWTLAAAAVAVAAAFWSAPLFGISPSVAALGATLCVAACLLAVLRDLGSRRRRSRAGRLGRRRLELLAEQSADMIVETDLALVRRYVSPASVAVLGFRPEDLVGGSVVQGMHPDDVAPFRAAVAQMREGSRERAVTTQRHAHEDGRVVWTESTFRAMHDPVTGALDGYVGALRDVTQQHLAESAVRSSETFLQGIIDASPGCVEVLDLDGHVASVSRNGLYLLDIERQGDIVGRDFAALWGPEARSGMRSAIAAAASGASSRIRARRTTLKGRILHLDAVIAPIPGPDGRPERLLALSRDVSAETRTEQALQSAQDRYRLLAENSSDVVLLRDPGPDGAILYASPSAERVLGFQPDQLMAEGAPGLIHPDDRDATADLLRRLGPEDGVVLHTHRLRRADGAFIWAEGAYHVAQRGRDTTVVVALRDVTERRQRAEDLAAAKETAERASAAKSDFLAVMSHEIRTPLNSIIGFNDLMLDAGDLPAGAAHQAELIRAAGAALMTVVDDVLDLSKAEAGAVELENLPFSPEALIQRCAAILRGYAGTKAIAVEVETDGPLPAALLGDEARLRQVLLNLLNNAVKFTPRDGRVTLRVARLDGAASEVALRFEVSDTGIGIADDRQRDIFERFSQADPSVSRRFGGSGLGLTICKRLVALMGGTIGVSSREGEGATFWFVVTLRPAPRAMPAPEPANDPGRPGFARILVAEDIDVNRRLAVALLETRGHIVDVVANGAEAVAAVASTAYDLVLMDVQMPGMDGVTATRRIRAAEAPHGRVPIVAMTANVFPDQVRAFREAGMDDHVAKPLSRAQLNAAVDRWTAGRTAHPGGGPREGDAAPA